jgi:hypothetical protein
LRTKATEFLIEVLDRYNEGSSTIIVFKVPNYMASYSCRLMVGLKHFYSHHVSLGLKHSGNRQTFRQSPVFIVKIRNSLVPLLLCEF